MIRLVQSADADKAKIVGLADRWATWIVVIALSAAILTGLFTHEVIRAVTILVVFCPCALVLATPTAIMAAIGNATGRGVLVREGDALERLSMVRAVTFDKTGTLTYGTPQVTAVRALDGVDADRLYALAAGAELRSEHPLGRAVVRGYRADRTKAVLEPTAFAHAARPGRRGAGGRPADRGGQPRAAHSPGCPGRRGAYGAGRARLRCGLHRSSIWPWTAARAGTIALADTLREDAARMIAGVQAAGVTPVLLTGDHEAAARRIAQQIGIREVHAGCRPEDKLEYIDAAQRAGHPVCMIGDGINDAPALKKALVGIAMGGVGSDIAVDAADIALVGDDISVLPHLLRLARRMMVTIRCNLTFSMALNFVAIILAITGVLGPVVGALVHNAGSVLVIVNSALLLGWGRRDG